MAKAKKYILGIGGVVAPVALFVFIVYNAIAKEVHTSRILKNPVTIEGKVVSHNLKGRNLQLIIDSSDMPINFSAYVFSFGFGESKYKHDFAAIQNLEDELKIGNKVKISGFKDPENNVIYGSDIERWEYVSLLKPRQ